MATLLLLSSCSTATVVHIPEEPELNIDILSAMRTWTDAGIENYSYRFRYIDRFGCQFPEVAVSVEHSIVSSMVFSERGSGCGAGKGFRRHQHASEELAMWNVTVAGLFARMIGIQDNADIFGMHKLLRTKFHPRYGFPVVIALDVPAKNVGLEDNRFEYRITTFAIR